MSSNLSIPESTSKSAGKQPYFQAKYLWLSAGISLVLWVAWVVTGVVVESTWVPRPLYFTEAPYWHIGLHIGAMATMSYPIIGLADRWYDQVLGAIFTRLG